MSTPETLPSLTVVVINHHLRGNPVDCLKSLGAANPPSGTDYLLVQGNTARECHQLERQFPSLRVLTIDRGDRATAKNRALEEARGDLVLFVTSDTIAHPNAIEHLRDFLSTASAPVLVSAQLLQENGHQRKTRYGFPSLLHESHPFMWLWRRYDHLWHKGRPPATGRTRSAEALHMTFLMARRKTFEHIGQFTEGYRFAHEDIEYCSRAARKGIARLALLKAHAYKMPPQLYGELSVPVRVAMERSLYRLARRSRGNLFGLAFRTIRKTKSLCKWIVAGILNRITCGCSLLLANEQATHRAVFLMPREDGETAGLPPDIESHVRWENAA